jgi:hypothetical protein
VEHGCHPSYVEGIGRARLAGQNCKTVSEK